MNDSYLPQHWLKWLEENKGGKLSADDFDGSVILLNFEDGSTASFYYAFHVVDKERNELAVFTEHCGYHVFSTHGLSCLSYNKEDKPTMACISDLFKKWEDEFADFESIPEAERRHPCQDVCAFIYLHEKLGGNEAIVSAGDHDKIYLRFDYTLDGNLTEEDVLYLTRCGVMYDSDTDSLAMGI